MDRWIKISLVGTIVILLLFLNKSCKSLKETQSFLDVSNSELKTERNEKGQMIASIKQFEFEDKKDFVKQKTNDSTILWLQSAVKQYKGKLNAAAVLSNSTSSAGTSNTITIHDTITGQPIYTTEWSSKWEVGSIIATKDSIYRDIKINNEFEITFGKENNGWFKKRESEAKITNLNPNTVTEEFRSFTIKQKPKRLSLGLQAGYGMTNNGLSPYVGFGINYSFVSIK